MQGKWKDSKPQHFFESPHLKVKYDAMNEFTKGFILYETVEGAARKYPYEALFRNDKWNIILTTGDPKNAKPFSDRDRDLNRFREIKGVPRFHRQDLAKDLNIKLSKFRANMLHEEAGLKDLVSRARYIQNGNSGDDYWLHEHTLIRMLKSPFREVFVAIELTDILLDYVSRYIF